MSIRKQWLWVIFMSQALMSLNLSADSEDNGSLTISAGEEVTIDGGYLENNVIVDGGTLKLINGATLTGNVSVIEGGQIKISSASNIDGNIDISSGDIESSNSNIYGNVLIHESTVSNFNQMDIIGNMLLKNTLNISIVNSTTNGSLEISGNGESATIANNIIYGDVKVVGIQISFTQQNHIDGSLKLITNVIAISLLDNVAGSIRSSDNEQSFIINGYVGKDLSLIDNFDTYATDNTVIGTFKIIPGEGTCLESGNVHGKLKGGCN
ncbi:hypothetical protein [Ferrimonas balearica]|uniref:hypothetical protein n=1 Tax=Ferrimonas balearica TaxID=44012 RepID=UPI001C99CA2E|nr:hypothetical protein [Ferrimonas balearica]MBY5920675.1 hypothetical protein [Ferrimonas balearica]MBY5996640.1 hypothetical protein [Ferrimonas balearica]